MITKRVTRAQLRLWKKLTEEKGGSLVPNRISGVQLDAYFRRQYAPRTLADDVFRQIVERSAADYRSGESVPDVRVYLANETVRVGIDLTSGFFHVECADIQKGAAVFDDLFTTRGLDEEDLQNYVLTGQYLELTARRNALSPPFSLE